jgi:hypothetical protein
MYEIGIVLVVIIILLYWWYGKRSCSRNHSQAYSYSYKHPEASGGYAQRDPRWEEPEYYELTDEQKDTRMARRVGSYNTEDCHNRAMNVTNSRWVSDTSIRHNPVYATEEQDEETIPSDLVANSLWVSRTWMDNAAYKGLGNDLLTKTEYCHKSSKPHVYLPY